MTSLLEVKDLKMHFPIHGGILKRVVGHVHAVNGVSLKLSQGETLGLVGESGCGKTTIGRTIVQLYKATAGEVFFEGQNLAELKRIELREARRQFQMIFQDPYESLNSRHTIRDILTEPFVIHKIKPRAAVKEAKRLLDIVGLSETALDKFPHEFSGGQRQRIGIARAIALKPKLIVCDEPVSALDVSIQSQILNLLVELQKEMGLAFLFIAHDLAVVRHISDRIAVMYLGKIIEIADADRIYQKPMHPYTQALISAIPVPNPRKHHKRQVLKGDVPSPINLPTGCHFHTRCPFAKEKCRLEAPELEEVVDKEAREHLVSCHFSQEIIEKSEA